MSSYSTVLRQSLGMISPGGRFGKLQILLYHRVLAELDPLRPWEIAAVQFDEQMRILSRYYNVLSLSEGLERLEKGSLPPQAVCITFDDGYEDNLSVALPILEKYKLSAVFFIATKFLRDGIMWNDAIIESVRNMKVHELDLRSIGLSQYSLFNEQQKVKAIYRLVNQLKYLPPQNRMLIVDKIVEESQCQLPHMMMTEESVVTLHRKGMEIGAHTVTHPILNSISPEAARNEIGQSKEVLEALIQERLKYFAYPNGCPTRDYSSIHCKMVKNIGFDAACSTWWGAATRMQDKFQLPRFTPWDKSAFKFMLRMTQYRMNRKTIPNKIHAL
ncbi:polysaccharide deacetylase family protein [Candidatus Berkiella cookevillensis]|uniref:Polysaccharide deacetylase n=1 Tax=Candidatus Berkiella cookevillensis TaxID=437022 RepID=A0A0Q9YB91_9GAMM|nr:polysaccharide deacetylase family protein [Candidatus Berkiella cookevillensis]MCS5709121.1 polysaccharide deacetylase family protein [Candidatus Berkiella cookevillensis]